MNTDAATSTHRVRPFMATAACLAIVALKWSGHLPEMAADDTALKGAEPWAAQTPEHWPMILLANSIERRSGTDFLGGDTFLVDGTEGRTFAIAPNGILGARTADPTVAWKLHVPGHPSSSVTARPHPAESGRENRSGLVILDVLADSTELPAIALHLRKAPLATGEKLYIITQRTEHGEARQTAAAGRLLKAGLSGSFIIKLETPFPDTDLAGAPVLDVRGHLLGVVNQTIHNGRPALMLQAVGLASLWDRGE